MVSPLPSSSSSTSSRPASRPGPVLGTASADIPLSSSPAPSHTLSPADLQLRDQKQRAAPMTAPAAIVPTPSCSLAPHSDPSSASAPPQCPPSPSTVTSASTDWPCTPTLTTAADISAPSTPVHHHFIAVATAAAAAATLSRQSSSNQPHQPSQHQQQPAPPMPPTHQPTEQLKRNWLNVWINNQSQSEAQDPYGFVSTNPSRTNSPHPSQSGSVGPGDSSTRHDDTTTTSVLFPVAGARAETENQEPSTLHPQTVNAPAGPTLSDDAKTPTLASMQQQQRQHHPHHYHHHHHNATCHAEGKDSRPRRTSMGQYEAAVLESSLKNH